MRIRRLLLAALFCLGAAPAWAAVAFDAKSTAACDAVASTISCSTLTIGAGLTNSAVVIYLNFNSPAAPTLTATWNGTTAPIVGTAQWSATGNLTGTAIFCLAAPASGNHAIAISATGTVMTELHVSGASFQGVNQTTPCKNAATITDSVGMTPAAPNATGTIAVTSATGDLATAIFAQIEQLTSSSNGTTLNITNAGPQSGYVNNYVTGTATASLTGTASGTVNNWEITGVDIAAAAGGGAVKGAIIIDEYGAFAP